MARSSKYYIRKTHRYLGVILGVQFFLWTAGGLYFSWTNIDEIHGDFQRKHVPRLSGNIHLVSPDTILKTASRKVDSIQSLQLINITGRPHYAVAYYSMGELKKVLADAQTGSIRQPINREEAIHIAAASYNGHPGLKSVEYLTALGAHHEYREKPLPAWAVTFGYPVNTTVYISRDFGQVESFRNNKWRIFDFLWMMHTMDYQHRDNFNNWLLRAFSLFGLLTIISGFVLFYVSMRKKRKRPAPE
jgi:hypothetical protein